jgi:hypothetical protein
MNGPLIGYGCFLPHPHPVPDATLPSPGWQRQPYADFESFWNERLAHLSFPLLLGGIETPDYLMLVVAAGERQTNELEETNVIALGNFAIPLARLETFLRERLASQVRIQAEQVWGQVVNAAAARSLVLEQQGQWLFVHEQDLWELD